MLPCFKFVAAKKKEDSDTIVLFDDIGFWGTQAKDFKAMIAGVKTPKIRVEINSPGGDVFAGIAMYNMLRASGKEVQTVSMGVAASAASIVFMAGDERIMPANTFLMVHAPWTGAVGNSDELRETADVLDKIGDSLLNTYVARSGATEDDIKALLAQDSWLTAEESVAMNLATEVIEGIKATASFDMKRADLPEHVRKVYASATAKPGKAPTPKAQTPAAPAPEPEPKPKVDDTDDGDDADPVTPEQVATQAKAAGLEVFAKNFAVRCETRGALKAAIENATAIQALGKLASADEKVVNAAIRKDTTVADFRAQMVKAMADADEHTDTTRPQKPANAGNSGAKAQRSSADLWNKHHENMAAARAKTTKKGS